MLSWELRTRSYRGPMEVRTYQCTPGSLIFPCHVVLLALPMWWGRVLLPV
jgi:hypothetical protein